VPKRMEKRLAPVHPGRVLAIQFLEPLAMSANQLALALHVPTNRITSILVGRRGITADTALRLGRYFNTGPEFWLQIQMDYELRLARFTVGEEVEKSVQPLHAA
jgi:antitoxin HigA-1